MNKLQSLHAFRGIFAILIFLHHYNLYGISNYLGFGAGSVALFFILSGFAISAGYQNKLLDGGAGITAKDFIRKRIKKVYPLHILGWLVWFIALAPSDINLEEVKKYSCNLLLLQSWVPSKSCYFSCNGVSWYLSSLLFCYIAYPALVRLIALARKHIFCAVGFVLVLMVIYATIIAIIPDEKVHAIVYISPAMRVIDFIIGMLLWNGLLYIRNRSNKFLSKLDIKTACTMQLVALTVMTLSFVCYVVCGLPEWFGLVSYWWLPCVLLIMTFALLDDYDTAINRTLKTRGIQKFADLSFSLFMIHVCYIQIWNYWLGSTWIGGSHEITFLFVFISCVAIAWAVHRYIESGVGRLTTKRVIPYREG